MSSAPTSKLLPTPPSGAADACAWVTEHLAHVCDDTPAASSIRGGQSSADAALASFDVTGYAKKRNEVHPAHRQGASRLSPYIRHGLLSLPRVWDAVAGGPSYDVKKFRDELLWQEYGRHLYARTGSANRASLRYEPAVRDPQGGIRPSDVEGMACLELVAEQLTTDGWLVNQTRMWWASHHSVRLGKPWPQGEDQFFRHLLDGSRAANRLGWQWTVGAGKAEPYGFSRFQVNKRAPGLCDGCPSSDSCPIDDWPDTIKSPRVDATIPLGRIGEDASAGPDVVLNSGDKPETVWLTAESLGDDDPALLAHPDLPVAFVFDEPLLRRLRLSGKRLIFLTETLGEIAQHRNLDVYLGTPASVYAERSVAVTYAPVPGFQRHRRAVDIAALHPWPWLRTPTGQPVQSFSAWTKARTKAGTTTRPKRRT